MFAARGQKSIREDGPCVTGEMSEELSIDVGDKRKNSWSVQDPQTVGGLVGNDGNYQ